MRIHFLKIVIVSAAAALFHNCAQVVPLSGGKRDTAPPKLLEASPPLRSTGFGAGEIILKFDERIQLKDLRNQLIVSPRLKTEPEMETDGKKLRISIKKAELQPNTTYRIFFGKALSDLNEGNSINDFEYVFSTGSYVDSLKLEGKVSDAFNHAGLNDVLVGLYSAGGSEKDSLAYKVLPDYISKSDNNGQYSFRNLPAGTFSLLAFADRNKNLVYDGESERIGFRGEPILLNKDSVQNLLLFSEESPKTFLRKATSPYYGKALLVYNKKCVFRTRPQNASHLQYLYILQAKKEKDTVTIYYKNIKDTLGLLVENSCNGKTDTVKLPLPALKLNKKKSLVANTNLQNGVLPWKQPLQLSFFNLLDTSVSDAGKLTLVSRKDTVMVREAVKAFFPEPYVMEIRNKLLEGISYALTADTAAIFDENGRYNDSLKIGFKLQNKAELGNITLKLLMNKKQPYIIQLLNEREQVSREAYLSLSLSSSNAANVDFEGLSPGSYRVKILFDDNDNGKWDSGNYLAGKQPERVFVSPKQIKVISDWEAEEEIQVK